MKQILMLAVLARQANRFGLLEKFPRTFPHNPKKRKLSAWFPDALAWLQVLTDVVVVNPEARGID